MTCQPTRATSRNMHEDFGRGVAKIQRPKAIGVLPLLVLDSSVPAPYTRNLITVFSNRESHSIPYQHISQKSLWRVELFAFEMV